MLCSHQCEVRSVQCTVCSVQCAMFILPCVMCIMQCALCSIDVFSARHSFLELGSLSSVAKYSDIEVRRQKIAADSLLLTASGRLVNYEQLNTCSDVQLNIYSNHRQTLVQLKLWDILGKSRRGHLEKNP